MRPVHTVRSRPIRPNKSSDDSRLDSISRGKPSILKEKPYNLNEYDLIVAFDPDWTEINQQQAEDLQLWVERQGGGLIYVRGSDQYVSTCTDRTE